MISITDTHTHLYLEQFNTDRHQVIEEAITSGVSKFLLPNVDDQTIEPMLGLSRNFPGHCIPMMGLHPTSVKPDFKEVLKRMRTLFETNHFCGIGETGIDLYWDKTRFAGQVEAFHIQIEWSLEMNLPLVIHSRNSVQEIMDVLIPYRNSGLKGVMHCFPGNTYQARWFTSMGFCLGIGGVVTYKNSEMAKVAKEIPLEYLLLETDAPYLPPAPHRGQRNLPSYLPLVAAKIAAIRGISIEEVARVTTQTANTLFKLT